MNIRKLWIRNFTDKRKKKQKKSEGKNRENILINTENTISNSLNFHHKPSTLPPGIKNAQIFFSSASLGYLLVKN